MGKKLSWEDAKRLGAMSDNDSIYARPNSYGYRINVNHPKIKPLYEKYKKKYGIMIMSDSERTDFENKLILYLTERKNK